MESIPKSGYYYANKIVLITLKALEDVMGKNGLNAVLNLAHLPYLIDNYPPDNLVEEFDFADFTAINMALEELYGKRGGWALALRAGRAAFADSLRNFGALAGANDQSFKVLPLQTKLRIGLPAMARIFNQISDQYSTVEDLENEYHYTTHRCPQCWGRSGEDKPVCYLGMGLLLEGLKWLSGGHEFHVYESQCIAMGDPVCTYVIQKTPIG